MDYTKIYGLHGKTALITGAGRGIGRALAMGLADFGCDIAAVDKDETHKDEVVREIQERGRKCLFFPGDVADGESIISRSPVVKWEGLANGEFPVIS